MDAAFLARDERERFRALARSCDAAFSIVSCEAPDAVLRERVATRATLGADASDAGVAVLEAQIAARRPLGEDEVGDRIVVDTTRAAA